MKYWRQNEKRGKETLKMFMLIKAVSDTVLEMVKAVYHDKPLIFIGAMRLSL